MLSSRDINCEILKTKLEVVNEDVFQNIGRSTLFLFKWHLKFTCILLLLLLKSYKKEKRNVKATCN